jgi:hypothetical protein
MHLITYLMLIDEMAAVPPVRIDRAIPMPDFQVNKVLAEFVTQERLAFICIDPPLPRFVTLPRD